MFKHNKMADMMMGHGMGCCETDSGKCCQPCVCSPCCPSMTKEERLKTLSKHRKFLEEAIEKIKKKEKVLKSNSKK